MDHDTVLSVLSAEILAVREFKSLLQAEQQSLVEGKVGVLAEISKAKVDQVEQLNRLAAERLRKLADQGYPPGRSGMDRWASDTGAAAMEVWQSMLEIAAEAQRINTTNGALIHSRLQNNQQALSALLSATNQASLYGPDGQRQGSLYARGNPGIIGKA